MKRILFVLASTLILFSCDVPEPIPESVPNIAVMDSVPTINLSGDTAEDETLQDYPVTLNMSSTGLHIEDGFTTIDKLGEIKSIEIRIVDDSITYLRINESVEFGEAVHSKSTFQPPFRLLDNNKILIMEGATLELIARYYNKKINTLKLCNSIKNVDYIEAGTVLKLSCCDECK